jgi:heme A synthase
LLSNPPPLAFRRLAVGAAALTYLLIIMGGIVRVTGSGLGCGLNNDWPLCNGALLPSAEPTAIIEFAHRWIAALATVMVLALSLSAWLTQRRHRRLVVASSLAAVLFVVQIVLGALTVKYRLPGGVVMIHLANALLLLGVLVYVARASVTAGRSAAHGAPALGLQRLIAAAAAATYVLALSGALVVERGAGAACASWPLCGGGLQLPAGDLATINVVHRVVAAVVVLFVAAVMGVLLRRQRDDPGLRRAAVLVNVVLVSQVAAGALAVEWQLPAAMRALHIALASGLWALVMLVAVASRAAAPRAVVAVDGTFVREPRRTTVGAASL